MEITQTQSGVQTEEKAPEKTDSVATTINRNIIEGAVGTKLMKNWCKLAGDLPKHVKNNIACKYVRLSMPVT